MSRVSVWPRGMAAAIAATLAFGACQPTTPPPSGGINVPSQPPNASPGASSPAASQAADVAEAFEAAYAAIKSGVIAVEGTVTIGEILADVSGTTTFNGPDSLDTSTTTVGGVATTTAHAKVAGIRYVKNGDGPWLQATTTPPAGADAALKQAATSVTDAGVETHAGQPLHKLVPATQAIDPTAFGLAGGATNTTATLTFYAKDDGTPVAVSVEMTWTQPQGAATVQASLSLEFTLSKLGERQVIAAPDPVWKLFKSKRWKFRLAYPDDFDKSKNANYDLFFGPKGEVVGAGKFSDLGLSLNELVNLSETYFKQQYNAKSFKTEDATLGGVRARLISVRGTVGGKKIILYDIGAVKGGDFYEIYWLVYAKNGPDDSTFQQIVATFSFK